MKRKQLFNHNEKLRFADRHYDKDLVIEMIDAGADPNSIIGYKVEGGGKKRRKISTKEAIWAAKKLDINLLWQPIKAVSARRSFLKNPFVFRMKKCSKFFKKTALFLMKYLCARTKKKIIVYAENQKQEWWTHFFKQPLSIKKIPITNL